MTTRITGGGGIPYNQLRELEAGGGDDGVVDVVTVAGVAPGEDGNILLTPGDIGAPTLVGGVVQTSQIPALATNEVVSVASQAAMLALTDTQVQPGDVAIRTDLAGHRFLLASAPASTLGNWIALETPDAVTTVNGQAGAVVLGASDVGTYTSAQIDATVAAAGGKFKGPYSSTATYAAGDVVASPAGDLVQAIGSVTPVASPVYIGAGGREGDGALALPSGTAVGDLAVLFTGNVAGVGGGSTVLATVNASGYGQAAYRVIDSATLATGSIAVNPGVSIPTAIVVFRAAGTPMVSSQDSAAVTSGAALSPVAQTATSGSAVLRLSSFFSTGGLLTSAASVASPLTAARSIRSADNRLALLASYQSPVAGNLAAGVGTITAPTLSGGTDYYARIEIVIPAVTGYAAGQWTKLVDTSSLKPKRVAVADANYAADGTESVIAFTSMTAPRTVTLPAAASRTAGAPLTIKAEVVGYDLTVSRVGSDAIQGVASIILSGSPGYGSVTLYSDGVSKWSIVRDTLGLAGKLDTTAGAVGVANLAADAKPALSTSAATVGTGSSITAGLGMATIMLAADGTATLPVAATHGQDKLLLVRHTIAGNAVSPYTLTLSRAGSDTIGLAGATTLVVPPSIGFTLLRASAAGRWEVIAGAGEADTTIGRTTVNDAAYTILATDVLVAVTAITAARILTLPAASAYPVGKGLVVKDESGAASATLTITVQRAGANTIDGGTASKVINTPYGALTFYSNGANWFTLPDVGKVDRSAASQSVYVVTAGGVQSNFGYASAATPNAFVLRDAAGRSRFAPADANGDVATFEQAMGHKPISGNLYSGLGVTSVGGRPAGFLTYHPFYLAKATTFDRIGAYIASPGAAGSLLRFGIYADAGAKPGALIVDGGTIDGTVVGRGFATISQVLAPGMHWLACGVQGGVASPSVDIISGNSLNPGVPVAGTTIMRQSAGYSTSFDLATTGALPAGPSATATPSETVILVVLRAA